MAGKAYSAELNAQIEAGFASGDTRVDVDGTRYIDTKEMKQVRYDNPSRWRRVRRQPPAEGVPPA
jgi:hypothetical protein